MTRYVPVGPDEATDKLIDNCLDHPNDNDLAAFEKFTK